MRVLLTGATGFIGSYVLKQLLNEKIDVVVVGRTKPLDSTVDFIEADLLSDQLNFEGLVQKASATHLLHLAWYAEHGKYWSSPLNLRWVEASVKLVEAFCKNGGKKVVVSGTCAEYDWSYGYLQEDVTPLKPSSLYGVSKDATRRLTHAICNQYETEFAWGRIFFAYGEGEPSSRLIPSLKRVFQGKQAPFPVNAEIYRDFLHASDVASAFLKLLSESSFGVYNICSERPITIKEVVNFIADYLHADSSLVLDLQGKNSDEPNVLIGKNQKILQLGWLPTKHYDFI